MRSQNAWKHVLSTLAWIPGGRSGALELWEFKIQMYQQPDGRAPVMPYRSPLTLKLRGIQDARAVVIKLATEKYAAVHSVTVTSPFGQERWFQIDGKWRYKDV